MYWLLLLLLTFGCSSAEKRTYVTRHLHERAATHCYPHMSGDVLRLNADHIVDDTRQPFSPQSVKEGDIIFLKTKYLGKFLKHMHPKINKRYILITGNGDEEAPGPYASLLKDNKLIHWFAMNATVAHPRLTPIPIGGGGMQPGEKENLIEKLLLEPKREDCLLYINFRAENHAERAGALEYFASQPFCTVSEPCSTEQFLRCVRHAKYVLCPRGNGLDTHRVWETWLLGSIPVLKHTELDPLYEGLPALFVDEWSEVTEKLLEERYEELSQRDYERSKLYADYWLQLIWQEKFDPARWRTLSYCLPAKK